MVAKGLGVKLEMQQITGANRIPFLLTDKVDIVISVMGLTPAAWATARNSARPLFIVSSHSFCGSESCTMPAPACTCRRPSWMTAVRMAMAVSASPHQLM